MSGSKQGHHKIIKPIELVSPWLPKGIDAIMLFPFIFYRKGYADNMPLRSHEYYHWYQAKKFGVFPWYLTYVFLMVVYLGRSKVSHPFEKMAYAEQAEVEHLIKSHKKTSDYLEKKYLV